MNGLDQNKPSEELEVAILTFIFCCHHDVCFRGVQACKLLYVT